MLGVKVVERHAFARCDELSYVECDKLERIEGGAFSSCKSLTSIDLSSVEIVGEYAFAHCAALKGAIFGDKLESIRGMAFDNCTSLEQITIPLKHGMFDDDNISNRCEKLERVDLVGGVHGTVAALLWRNGEMMCMKLSIVSIRFFPPTTTTKQLRYDVGLDQFFAKLFIIKRSIASS